MEKQFYFLLVLIGLILIGLLSLYFYNFHGELSNSIADWSNFSTFITSIVMMCLTALNVWVFYTLTSNIETKKNFDKILQWKLTLTNNFHNNLYKVFQPDDDESMCNYNSIKLYELYQYLESQKTFANVLQIYGSQEYLLFVKQVFDFGKLDKCNTPEEIGNYNLKQRAYEVLQNGRKIHQSMIKEIADYMNA